MYFLPLHPVLSKDVSHACLPSMWPGFESWRRRHMQVEFVVDFLPCTLHQGFSPGTSVLPSALKPTLSNSNSIWNARTRFKSLSRGKVQFGSRRFLQLTRKISPIALYTGQRFIQWITIEKPLPGSYMLVPMLSLHCMALHFFRRNHGPESTVRRLIIARRRHQRGYNSSDLYLSFIQVLSSPSQDIDLRFITVSVKRT